MHRLMTTLLAVVALVSCASCSSSQGNSPYSGTSDLVRDTAKAQRLTTEAAEALAENPEKAEELLRKALAADLWLGPAHNNLGVILLQRKAWYEAAGEFEWARKLMPGHPDPRMNLALTFERAGRTDEAMATYESALEVYPGHIPTIQALARLQIRASRTDNRTPELLREIALAGETPQWRAWAQERLVLDPTANASQPDVSGPAP